MSVQKLWTGWKCDDQQNPNIIVAFTGSGTLESCAQIAFSQKECGTIIMHSPLSGKCSCVKSGELCVPRKLGSNCGTWCGGSV